MNISRENRARKNTFQLTLSDEELQVFNNKWQQSGLKSRNAFLRNLILYGFVYDVDYKDLREYNTQLAHIGNNLNQIAKRANENGYATSSDLKETKEINVVIHRTNHCNIILQHAFSVYR